MLIDPFLHYSQAPRNSLMCLGTGCGRACEYLHHRGPRHAHRQLRHHPPPRCITVDHDTLTDNCVTIRHRDTMQQERVSIDRLHDLIDREVNMKNLFRKIMGQV